MSSERQWLAKALEAHLLPALEAAGYTRLPLAGEDKRSAEIRSGFPFGRHRRQRPGEDHFVQVEVQLDKHQAAACRLNFARIPAAGIQHAAGPVSAEDMWIHYLPGWFELLERPWLRQWFAVRKWLRGAPSREDHDALALEIARLLPEIDAALGEPGASAGTSHVRRV